MQKGCGLWFTNWSHKILWSVFLWGHITDCLSFRYEPKKRNVYISNSSTNLSLSHIQSIYSGSSVCNSPRVIEILCVHVHRTRIVNDNRFRSLSLLILRKIQLCSTNPIVFSTRTQANKSSHIHKTTFAWMKNEQKKMRSTCELDLLLVKIYLSGTMLIESK